MEAIMNILHRRAAPALALFALAAPGIASALDYDPSRTYTENCVVAYKNDVFRAKWWVEANHTPANVASAANPWDTPWERAAPGSPTGCPGGDPGDPGNPDPGEPGKIL